MASVSNHNRIIQRDEASTKLRSLERSTNEITASNQANQLSFTELAKQSAEGYQYDGSN